MCGCVGVCLCGWVVVWLYGCVVVALWSWRTTIFRAALSGRLAYLHGVPQLRRVVDDAAVRLLAGATFGAAVCAAIGAAVGLLLLAAVGVAFGLLFAVGALL